MYEPDYRHNAAENIITNIKNYSREEIINAIRYAGRKGDSRLLKNFFDRLPYNRRENIADDELLSTYTLEIIRQSVYCEDNHVLEYISSYWKYFNEAQLLEAIRAASQKDNEQFLAQMSRNLKLPQSVRVAASDSLFNPKIKDESVFNDDVNVRNIVDDTSIVPKEEINHDKESEVEKVFISYKKSDQWFADQVVDYLEEFHRDSVEVIFDEFEIVAGDSLTEEISKMLDRYETCLMVWSPEYFSESGWAQIEKDAILNSRVNDGRRFVPLFLRGDSSIIPSIFSHYVYVDFRNYDITKNPIEFNRKMRDVLRGIHQVRTTE